MSKGLVASALATFGKTRALGSLLVALAAVSFSQRAPAELCGAAFTAGIAKVGQTLTLSAPAHSCVNKTTHFWSIYRPDGTEIRKEGFSVTFIPDVPGAWRWDMVGYNTMCHQCMDSGSIPVEAGCALDVTAAPTPRSPATSLEVDFSASVRSMGVCSGTLAYKWEFGDGVTSTSERPSHLYARIKPWDWKLTVTQGATTAQKSGTVGLPCLKVGSLALCSSNITQVEEKNEFGFGTDFNVNGVLAVEGSGLQSVTYAGDPAATPGTLTITTGAWARLYVPSKEGREWVWFGRQKLVAEVRGAEGSILPAPGSGNFWAFAPGGVPLAITERPLLVKTDAVELTGIAFFGFPGVVDIAKLEASWRITKGGESELLRTSLQLVSATPTIQLADLSAQWIAAEKRWAVRTKAGLWWAEAYPIDVTWYVANCGCGFQGFDAVLPADWLGLKGFPLPTVFGVTPLVNRVRIKMDHLCEEVLQRLKGLETTCGRTNVVLGFSGRLTLCPGVPPLCVEIPAQFLRIDNVGLEYVHPVEFTIKGGEPQILGYSIASAKGKFLFGRQPGGLYLSGWASLAGLVQGEARLLTSFNRLHVNGNVFGNVQVPDFACSPVNVPCRLVKDRLRKRFGTLPAAVGSTSLDVSGDVSCPGGECGFTVLTRGLMKFGSFTPVIVIELRNGDLVPSVSVGTNYSNIISILGSSAFGNPAPLVTLLGTEKSLTLPGARDDVTFGVAAQTRLPSISLRNPQGQTITPSNAASFPGVTYQTNLDEKLAYFEVASAAAGTWTIVESTLPAGELTFAALAAPPPPELTFTSVAHKGETVSIAASVAKASPTTKVTFLYSLERSAGTGEPIASDLPASSGSVTASWDVATLPSGTYYVFARTEDGVGAPIVTYHATPVDIERGLAAPTGLTGTRSGTTVELSFTPVPGAAGYQVLYTDAPEEADNPYSRSTNASAGVSVEDLDASKQYRFTVAAFDGTRNLGPESRPYYTGTPPASDESSIAGGSNLSDSVAAGGLKHYTLAVPSDAEKLTVTTRNASADVDILLRFGARPDASTADYRAATTSGNETLAVTKQSSPRPLQPGNWYIAVSGRQASTYSLKASIDVTPGCSLLASATVPATAFVGSPVSFQGSTLATGCSGAATFAWNFGDQSALATQQNTSHTYAAAGTYSWSLTAVGAGETARQSGSITVSGASSPAAAFSFTPPSPSAGQTVQFTDTSTGGPKSWSWDFGDGFGSAAQNPTHAFATAGAFAVALTAGSGSGSSTATKTVSVASAAGTTSCVEDATTMCLVGGRYRIRSHWKNQYAGGAVSALSKTKLTDVTGAFWIANSGTYEYLIRFNKATTNGRIWVVVATFTDVEFWIDVTDTRTGQSKEYHSAAGNRTLIFDPSYFVFP